MRLQNKVAVVIGGTSGIGQALARGFLRWLASQGIGREAIVYAVKQ